MLTIFHIFNFKFISLINITVYSLIEIDENEQTHYRNFFKLKKKRKNPYVPVNYYHYYFPTIIMIITIYYYYYYNQFYYQLL